MLNLQDFDKLDEKAMIRNGYNQIPDPAQDTKWAATRQN